MVAILKIDASMLRNRLGWRGECGQEMPEFTPGYLGIYAGADLSSIENTEMGINRRVSVQLDCSVAPAEGHYMYHALIALNPALVELAECTAPTLVFPGSGRVRPVVHIRGLRKFDLADLDWVATIHLVD